MLTQCRKRNRENIAYSGVPTQLWRAPRRSYGFSSPISHSHFRTWGRSFCQLCMCKVWKGSIHKCVLYCVNMPICAYLAVKGSITLVFMIITCPLSNSSQIFRSYIQLQSFKRLKLEMWSLSRKRWKSLRKRAEYLLFWQFKVWLLLSLWSYPADFWSWARSHGCLYICQVWVKSIVEFSLYRVNMLKIY